MGEGGGGRVKDAPKLSLPAKLVFPRWEAVCSRLGGGGEGVGDRGKGDGRGGEGCPQAVSACQTGVCKVRGCSQRDGVGEGKGGGVRGWGGGFEMPPSCCLYLPNWCFQGERLLAAGWSGEGGMGGGGMKDAPKLSLPAKLVFPRWETVSSRMEWGGGGSMEGGWGWGTPPKVSLPAKLVFPRRVAVSSRMDWVGREEGGLMFVRVLLCFFKVNHV